MPKLSKQTLEKRFLCPHCGRTFRTRQGLSGHVQFKHKLVTSAEENPYMKTVLDALKFKTRAEIAEFKKEEIAELGQMVGFWKRMTALCEDDNIKFNATDFKTYLIISLSQMRANQGLLNALRQEFGTTISELLKIQSNMTLSKYEKQF